MRKAAEVQFNENAAPLLIRTIPLRSQDFCGRGHDPSLQTHKLRRFLLLNCTTSST
jgi:hypothetical protein